MRKNEKIVPSSVFRIVIAEQTVFPLADLPDHVPKRRGGKMLHLATGYRWRDGAQARDGTIVRLPTIRVGGTTCTSVEALQWFCERLSVADEP